MAPEWVMLCGSVIRFGQSEIGNVRFTLLVDQNIGRLEIAVQHAMLMSEVDGRD